MAVYYNRLKMRSISLNGKVKTSVNTHIPSLGGGPPKLNPGLRAGLTVNNTASASAAVGANQESGGPGAGG